MSAIATASSFIFDLIWSVLHVTLATVEPIHALGCTVLTGQLRLLRSGDLRDSGTKHVQLSVAACVHDREGTCNFILTNCVRTSLPVALQVVLLGHIISSQQQTWPMSTDHAVFGTCCQLSSGITAISSWQPQTELSSTSSVL